MSNQGFPNEVVEAIRDSVDCNLYFFGNRVAQGSMYLILAAAIVLALGIYVGINILEHSAHNAAFAAFRNRAYKGACLSRDFGGTIRRFVVVNINGCVGQNRFGLLDDIGNRDGFVIARDDDGGLGHCGTLLCFFKVRHLCRK